MPLIKLNIKLTFFRDMFQNYPGQLPNTHRARQRAEGGVHSVDGVGPGRVDQDPGAAAQPLPLQQLPLRRPQGQRAQVRAAFWHAQGVT